MSEPFTIVSRFTLQAIETKYFGPQNMQGARMKATAQAVSITIPYDHSINEDSNHVAAARALVAKYTWDGEYAHGVLANGNHVFACTGR